MENKNTQNSESFLDLDFGTGEVQDIEDFLDDEDLVVEKEEETNGLTIDPPVEEESLSEESLLEEDEKEEAEEVEEGNKEEEILDEDEILSDSEPKEVLKKLFESKVIDEIEVFEMENGEEIPFDEMDLTFEDVSRIISDSIQSKVEEVTKDKVSTKDVSDFTKKLIEIEKNGGNVKQAIDSYERYKSPIDSIDISTEEGKKAAIYLRLQASSLEEETILDLIDTYEQKGILDEKAVEAESLIKEAFDKQMEKINEEAIKAKEEHKKFLKEYSKSLDEQIASQFKVDNTLKNKLVKYATKAKEDGKYDLDIAYNEYRRDPEKAAKLALFFYDEDEFIKQVTNKEVNKEKEKTFNKFRITRKKMTGNPTVKRKDKPDDSIDPNEI